MAGSETGAGGDGPLLSPRGRGYLARLVLEVCAELEESKSRKVIFMAKNAVCCCSSRRVGLCSVLYLWYCSANSELVLAFRLMLVLLPYGLSSTSGLYSRVYLRICVCA